MDSRKMEKEKNKRACDFFFFSVSEVGLTEKKPSVVQMSCENVIFDGFLFSEERIRNGSKKLTKARATTQQGRLDKFFSVSRSITTTTPTAKKAESPIAANKGLKRKKNAATTETKPKGKAGGGSAKKPKVK